MAQYRFYPFDYCGLFKAPPIFMDAADDAEALMQAVLVSKDYGAAEVWLDTRLVCRVPKPSSVASVQSHAEINPTLSALENHALAGRRSDGDEALASGRV
jgi:hypothetical protein